MAQRSILSRIVVGVTGVGLGIMMMAGPAHAKDGVQPGRGKVTATCSSGVKGKLEARARKGGIEVRFAVESHQVGQAWAVTVTDNGATVYDGTTTTSGSSGEFKVRRNITDQAGTDAIVAQATSGALSCTANLSI